MVLFAVVTNVTIVDMRLEWLPSLRLKCTSQAAIKATSASASALKVACLNKYKDGLDTMSNSLVNFSSAWSVIEFCRLAAVSRLAAVVEGVVTLTC